jgi:hypothetical protein
MRDRSRAGRALRPELVVCRADLAQEIEHDFTERAARPRQLVGDVGDPQARVARQRGITSLDVSRYARSKTRVESTIAAGGVFRA